jgi:hypothetical protein
MDLSSLMENNTKIHTSYPRDQTNVNVRYLDLSNTIPEKKQKETKEPLDTDTKIQVPYLEKFIVPFDRTEIIYMKLYDQRRGRYFDIRSPMKLGFKHIDMLGRHLRNSGYGYVEIKDPSGLIHTYDDDNDVLETE